MSTFMDRLTAWLKRQSDDPDAAKFAEILDDEQTIAKVGIVDFTNTPEYKKLRSQLDAQNAKLAEFSAARSGEKAEAIVERLRGAGKLLPVQVPAVTAIFTRALQDDEDAQAVVFSIEGKADFKGSRADALEALFNASANVDLTQELLSEEDAKTKALFNKSNQSTGIDPYATAARYKEQAVGKATKGGQK